MIDSHFYFTMFILICSTHERNEGVNRIGHILIVCGMDECTKL